MVPLLYPHEAEERVSPLSPSCASFMGDGTGRTEHYEPTKIGLDLKILVQDNLVLPKDV